MADVTPTNITTYYQGALTGNLITIEIASSVIGLVQSLQAQEDFGQQPVSGIGQVTPVEHAPSITRINLSCETIYISTNAALQAQGTAGLMQAWTSSQPPRLYGGMPKTGTLESIGIIPATPADILRGAVFDIVVYRLADYSGTLSTPNGTQNGSSNNNWVRKYSDCSYAGGSISFQKHQIVIQNATFMALNYIGGSAQAT